MPSLESLEAAAASLRLETVRMDSLLRVRLNRLGLFLAEWSVDFSRDDGRTSTKLRAGSMSEWHLRLLVLATVTPMFAFFIGHPRGGGIPALLLIAPAVIPFCIREVMVRNIQAKLFRRASELEALAA